MVLVLQRLYKLCCGYLSANGSDLVTWDIYWSYILFTFMGAWDIIIIAHHLDSVRWVLGSGKASPGNLALRDIRRSFGRRGAWKSIKVWLTCLRSWISVAISGMTAADYYLNSSSLPVYLARLKIFAFVWPGNMPSKSISHECKCGCTGRIGGMKRDESRDETLLEMKRNKGSIDFCLFWWLLRRFGNLSQFRNLNSSLSRLKFRLFFFI